MNHPLVSLITVTFNAEKVLDETLKSAVQQTYKNIELVIVDGGSTDHTLEIARKYSDITGTLISEKDQGIYDAMNKGIRAAKGEWVYFLNAGDSFYSKDVLKQFFEGNAHADKDFLYAKVQTIHEPTGVDYLNGKPVSFNDFYFSYPICHQATFTRKAVFDRIGLFDIGLKLASDTEWFVRLFREDEHRTEFINEVVAFYDVQGASYHKRMQGYKEFLRFIPKYFPWYVVAYSYFLYPFLWIKVKLIRILTGTAIFSYYRKLKFNTN